MAASSNSSLSGSSVSSGKFLRRAPHFSLPSILAGSYLSAERLAVPLAPSPRRALPRGGDALPGVSQPSGGTERASRDGGSAAGPGSPPRRPTVPLCGVRERGAPRPGAASLLAREGARPARYRELPPRGWGGGGRSKTKAHPLPWSPLNGTRPRVAPRRVGAARGAPWGVLWHTSRFQYFCRTGNN